MICKNSIMLAFAFASLILAAPPLGKDILKKIETSTEIGDAKAKVLMTQQKAGLVKNLEMMYYRRDKDNAFLIVMTSPEAEKGNGYLRMDDNFWMYRRNTRTFQHINRDESIGGSDARGDDFENRKLTEMYAPDKDSAGNEMITEEMLGKIAVYKMQVAAKVNDVDYPKKIYWVRKDNFLLLKEEAYSNSGTHMQTAYYLKYSPIGEKFIPIKQIFIDEFEKGNKTVVELSGVQLGNIDNTIFTKAYLENLSK